MEIRSVETQAELEEVIDTYVHIFTQITGSGYYPFLERYSKMLRTDPTYRMEQTRIILEDGRIVGSVRVADRKMKIGSALVNLAGIADVYTHPQFRGKGYARALMEHTLKEYMVDRGYDLTILFGVPNFYPQFGYVTALPNYTTTVEVSKTGKVKEVGKLRKFRKDDLAALMDIHRASESPLIGTILRSKDFWLSKIRLSGNWYVLADDGSKVVGYIGLSINPRTPGFMGGTMGEEGVTLFEVGVREAKWCEGLLYATAKQARKANFETITMNLPPDHIFAKYCYEACGSENRDSSTAFMASGGMIRIIDFNGIFSKLESELSQRVQTSSYKDWRGDLLIKTDLGEVKLILNKGHVKSESVGKGPGRVGYKKSISKNVIKLPQTVLARLLVGYNSIGDARIGLPLKINDEMVGLLKALFPPSHPYLWRIDRF